MLSLFPMCTLSKYEHKHNEPTFKVIFNVNFNLYMVPKVGVRAVGHRMKKPEL